MSYCKNLKSKATNNRSNLLPAIYDIFLRKLGLNFIQRKRGTQEFTSICDDIKKTNQPRSFVIPSAQVDQLIELIKKA